LIETLTYIYKPKGINDMIMPKGKLEVAFKLRWIHLLKNPKIHVFLLKITCPCLHAAVPSFFYLLVDRLLGG
jgi:hypothetical protein